MKNLLSMLAVFTLVGTSANNLKPVFTSNVVNHGFKSNQLNNNIKGSDNLKKSSDFITKSLDKDDILSIALQKKNQTYIYARSWKSGLYKSTNRGESFDKVKGLGLHENGLKSKISSVAVIPNGTIYVTEQWFGLYKSTNGGESFDKVNFDYSFVTYVTNDLNGTIYVGTNKGLYKSIDGINFNQINFYDSVWSIAIHPDSTIYVGNASGIYKSTNGGESFDKVKDEIGEVRGLAIAPNGTIYVGTSQGLWKNTDGIKFIKINQIFNNADILSITISSDDRVYVGTSQGLYKVDLLNSLFTITKPDYFGYLYNGFVYKNEQTIELSSNYLKIATLDGILIDVSSKQKITVGIKHNLNLTLNNKDNCNQYLDLFGGVPNSGLITFNFWIKNEITQDEFNYSTISHDTDLLTGLVANISTANTYNSPIIQTKQKDGSGVITLNTKITSKMINFETSYYEQGTVNETTNDFKATGSKQGVFKNLSIQTDGIYHLHLVDMIGNEYDSYLELGKSNWKLQGKFDDQVLNDKANKLNVTVDSHSASQEVKQEANGWLDNYKNLADSSFNSTVLSKGKGFNITILSDLKGDYKSFLDPVIYIDSKTSYAINQIKLNDEINKIAEQKLQDGLTKVKLFTEHLNVDAKNVVNKSTLDNYTSWIKGYDIFINNNKDQWINDIEKIASRGFATTEQENNIKAQVSQFLNNDNIKNYLKNVVWKDNKLLEATSSDYNQFIELDKLQSDTINWVNTNMKDINIAYQQAIKNAESGLNLHGYSISEILNGKQKPQTKNEIDNFADGQSYHDWLQSQANIKFRSWGLLLGFSIGIPLILLSVVAGIFICWRTNPKYRGYWRARQLDKQDKVAEMKKRKNIRKENKGIKKNHDE
ncbi:MAG: hypothetical protein PPFGHCPK_01367 (plasmid) [Spiroplasma endosymbiont of Drosophila atripex]|nr:MAG: hypothetical protein PPFGHCPK_01367 [Spiroplasma endosymbiont of Drosophila atripex]